MVDRRLENATKELRQFFNLFSLEELVDETLKKDVQFITQQGELTLQAIDPLLINELNQVVVETQRGALLSKDLVTKILQVSEGFVIENLPSPLLATVLPYYDNREELLELHGDDGVIANIVAPNQEVNESPTSPSKNSPSMSVFQINNTRISQSNKNANAVSIFMNSVPSIELSRAMPFIDIKFQVPQPVIVNNRVAALSLVKFLEGAKNVSEFGDGDMLLLQGNSAANASGDLFSSGTFGMEMFTAPQMLVNADTDNQEEFRVVPVIDKFRPFASLTKFEVDVTPAPGIMSYRTAQLQFTLHDSSRLHEIAAFIKPDMYNQSEILIEYGWAHPGGEDRDNPFGNFLNSLRVKEKYYVKNNKFNFKDNREVDVTLELYTKGALDFYTSNISEGSDTVVHTQKEIQRLQERIRDLRGRVFKQEQKYVKEIRGAQILNAASDGNAELQLSRPLKRELRKILDSLGNKAAGDEAKELRQLLINLYGDKDGTGGEAKKLGNSIASAIQQKLTKIELRKRDDGRTPDPFLVVQDLTEKEERKGKADAYVSLAKLMMIFIGEPLVATNKFDDIQFLFYTFNNRAGKIRNTNIGAFAVEIENFKSRYKKVATSKRSSNLTLRDFLQFITNAFVEDVSNINYGMRRLYDYEPDLESGKRIKAKRAYKDATILNREIEHIMRCEAGIPDGVFKMPHIDVSVECVPADVSDDGDTTDGAEGKTVLRIHVFDKIASAYATQGDLLRSARDNNISTLGNAPTVDEDALPNFQEMVESKALLELAKKRTLIEEIQGEEGEEKVFQVIGGPTQLKEFIGNTMPVIRFGVNNTAVIDGGLKSMTDSRLSTINMIRSGDAGPLTPTGAAQGGLPMRLLPASMDMRTIGCPIVEYAQQFFCDFDTGTTVDNVYTVTKIRHTITPGKFESSLGLTPTDAYGQYESMVQKIGAAIKILGPLTDIDISQTPESSTPEDEC